MKLFISYILEGGNILNQHLNVIVKDNISEDMNDKALIVELFNKKLLKVIMKIEKKDNQFCQG